MFEYKHQLLGTIELEFNYVIKSKQRWSIGRDGNPYNPSAKAENTVLEDALVQLDNEAGVFLDTVKEDENLYYELKLVNVYKSKSGKTIPRNKTPDVDNTLKLINDSLNCHFWVDDRLAYKMVSEQWEGSENRSYVTISYYRKMKPKPKRGSKDYVNRPKNLQKSG